MKKINKVTKVTFLLVLITTIIHMMYLPTLSASASADVANEELNIRQTFTYDATQSAYAKMFDLYYELKQKEDSSINLTDIYLQESDALTPKEIQSFEEPILHAFQNSNNSQYVGNLLNSSFLYYGIDNETKETVSNTSETLAKNEVDGDALANEYAWYLTLSFDKNGKITVDQDNSSHTDIISQQTYYNAWNSIFPGNFGTSTVSGETVFHINDKEYKFQPITNAAFRFAIQDFESLVAAEIANYTPYSPNNSMLEMIITFGSGLLVAVIILILKSKKQVLIGFESNEKVEDATILLVLNDKLYDGALRNIPVEMMLIIDMIVFGLCTNLGWLAYSTVPTFFILFLVYTFSAYNIWYYMLLILERDIKKHSLLVIAYRYLRRPAHKIYNYALHLDMTNQDTRRLTVLVSMNLLLLLFISLFYAFETKFILLLLYSAGLYWVLKKYIGSVNTDYHRLLNVIRNIAIGKTNNHIEENLGLFEPFKPELKDIQVNIETAIQEEVHSQQMKTELITNVSHDLKTPLTSLISYIDLLKKEDISAKDRKKYLDIIDKSSLRLKHLVEDLFEVSKANSGNIDLNLVKIDFISLIKQVEVECDDALKKQKLTIRNTFSDDKMMLTLDPQKTYRIVENLISNISKYALKGTRVYIDVKDYDSFIELSMKNISAKELNFDVEDITERFMRGDKSRNSEGSGLGLAIVKSFTELQNGTLKIQTEGDLFKVFIRFPNKEV